MEQISAIKTELEYLKTILQLMKDKEELNTWINAQDDEDKPVWSVYTRNKYETYEDEEFSYGEKLLTVRTVMKRSFWTVTGPKPVFNFVNGVCATSDFGGDGEIELDYEEPDSFPEIILANMNSTEEQEVRELFENEGVQGLTDNGWESRDCESYFTGPLIIELQHEDEESDAD